MLLVPMASCKTFRSGGGRFLTKHQFEKRDKISKVPKKKAVKSPAILESCRRIVDLNLLAETLWCETCDVPLTLRSMLGEKMSGLNSTFKVHCNSCGHLKDVNTSKNYFRKTKSGRSLYDVNMKVTLGNVPTSYLRYFIVKFINDVV